MTTSHRSTQVDVRQPSSRTNGCATGVCNGPQWLAVLLRSADEVLVLKPDFIAMGELKVGVIGPQPAGQDTAFEIRAFAPALGMPEDPVTGSLNAGIAQWPIGAGRAPPRYVAAQGTALGRSGRMFVERVDADTWIGGHVAGCIEGRVAL